MILRSASVSGFFRLTTKSAVFESLASWVTATLIGVGIGLNDDARNLGFLVLEQRPQLVGIFLGAQSKHVSLSASASVFRSGVAAIRSWICSAGLGGGEFWT